MATHDYNIANQSGASFRQDLNNVLSAIVTLNSSDTEPATKFAHMLWLDTANDILKIRNADNNAWIDWITQAGVQLLPDGTVGAPGLTFASETDSGLYRIAANTLGIATSGTERVEISDTGIIINEDGDDADVRIEGDSEANLVFIDAGNNRVGIGTSSPSVRFDLLGAANSEYMRVGGSSRPLRFSCSAQGAADNANHDIDVDSSAGSLSFSIGTLEKMRLDSSGRLLIGVATSYANGDADDLQVGNNSASAESGITLGSTTGSGLRFADASDASAGLIQYKHSDNSMRFNTNGSNERMRISSGGGIGFGGGITIGNVTPTSNTAIYIGASVITSGAGNSTLKYSTASGLVTYDTSSRLVKENITDCPYGIESVKQLQPRKYFRTDDQNEEIGFIADELVEVLPEFVPVGPKSLITKNEEDTEEIPLGVNYEKLTAVLTSALQEAIAKIETLETKVAALEAG